MKKFIVLTLLGLLIAASTASAQKLEFKASGSIDFNTVYTENVPFYFGQVSVAHARHDGILKTWTTPSFTTSGRRTGSLDNTAAYAYSRGLLKFDAIMGKELSGTIMFELDALRWGDFPGGNLTKSSERNTMGVWSTDKAAVEVKNVYFDFGLPYFGIPVPMTVRIGAQPFGVRPRIFLYTDGVGITGGIKIDPVTIIPMWAKIAEGSDYASDDSDLYGLHVNAKVGTFTIGGYGLYYNMNKYPLLYTTGVDFTNIGAAGFTGSSSWGPTIVGTQKAAMWWLGLYADGKLGPLNLNFDFVYDDGKVESRLTPSAKDVDYSGWATRLALDFPWEKFNFGVVGMYATGADAKKTSAAGLPGQTALTGGGVTRKVGSYVVPPASETAPGAGEAVVMYSCFNASADGGTGIGNTGSYYQLHRGGFGGTWFAKLYGSAKLTPWYKLTLQGLYIGDTTKHGNTFGTAIKPGTSLLRDDKTIGWEVDLIHEIDIYKNLKWYIGMGYLFAGDALDVYTGSHGATSNLRNYSPNNPWNITTRMIYSF